MQNTPEKNQPVKSPEFYKERKEKRETLKEFLPEDLKLIYGHSIKPNRWQFEGGLVKRRYSEEKTKRIFFEALDKYNVSKEIDVSLFSEVKKNKKEVSELLRYDQQLQEGLDQYVKEGQWSDYANLLSKMAELGKELPPNVDQQLQEGLDQCVKEDWWSDYANLLSKMAELGKELPPNVDQQLQEGLDQCVKEDWWSDYANLLSKMAELGKINFNNNQYKGISGYLKKEPEENQVFLSYNISANLLLNKDLLKYKENQYDKFKALRETSIQINEKIEDENKKVRDPGKWWENNGKFFGKFLALGDLAQSIIKEKIREGIPSVQGLTVIYEDGIKDDRSFELINEAVLAGKFNHPHELSQFIEITNAFTKAGKLPELEKLLKEESKEPINKIASERLLAIITSSVGIDPEKIEDKDLSLWKTEFLANLSSNDSIMEQMIKSGDDGLENARELYRELLKAVFEGRFNDFLFNQGQSSEAGQDVARHNENTRKIFEQKEINYDQWLNHKDVHDFIVSTEVLVDKTKSNIEVLKNRAEKVLETFSFFKDILSNREYEPLLHILQGAGGKKSINLLKGSELENSLVKLEERIQTLRVKEEYKKYEAEWGLVFEHMGHLREAVLNINKKGNKETESRQKSFRIKVWDRDPRKDLFQGNFSQCCIAVGLKNIPPEGGLNTHDPSTVMQFLSDTGIQVVEILDQEKRNPIGNTWLFVSKNDLGEPILVADNIELHSDYTNDPHIAKTIRDNLFSFLARYAKDSNLAGVGLGLVSTNDVPYDDLKRVKIPPVDKIDGYLENYTSSKIRPGRYYLETYNHVELGNILPEVFEGKTKEKREIEIIDREKAPSLGFLIVSDFSGETVSLPYTQELLEEIARGNNDFLSLNNVEEIERIEEGKFGEIAQSIEAVLATLQNTRGIQFISKENGRVVGYLSSRPANSFHPPVRHELYDASDDVLYLESIAGKIDPFETMRLLKEKAKEAGYSKISLHGINPRLNNALTRYGFELKDTVHNWLGKTAGYMEMEL